MWYRFLFERTTHPDAVKLAWDAVFTEHISLRNNLERTPAAVGIETLFGCVTIESCRGRSNPRAVKPGSEEDERRRRIKLHFDERT